jgi:hypothetical protein
MQESNESITQGVLDAAANDGKIGYALFSSPKQWTLLDSPFGTENLRAVKFGGGIFLIVSESGDRPRLR